MRLRDGCVCVAVLAILFYFIWKLGLDINVVTCAILFVTMLVVIRYTVATDRMRTQMVRQTEEMIKQTKEMIKQTELSIRPQIIAYLDDEGEYFFIRNVGYGTAMNIMVEAIDIWKEPPKDIKIAFSRIDAIMPKEKKKLIHVLLSGGRKIDRDFMAHLNPEWANQTFQLNITYDNIERDKYSSQVQCGKMEIRLMDTEKTERKRYTVSWIPTEEDKVIVEEHTFVPLIYIDEFHGSNNLNYFIKRVRSVADKLEEGRAFEIIDTKTGKIVKRFKKEGGVVKEEEG